jgi:hypothetical protein
MFREFREREFREREFRERVPDHLDDHIRFIEVDVPAASSL